MYTSSLRLLALRGCEHTSCLQKAPSGVSYFNQLLLLSLGILIFVYENIIFGISILDYPIEFLEASPYDKFGNVFAFRDI